MNAEQIQAISSIATVIIALATIVIAAKQTKISGSQTEIAQGQKTLGEQQNSLIVEQNKFLEAQTDIANTQLDLTNEQAEFSRRLTALEEARDTPIIVAGELERIGTNGLSLTIHNAGGGAARSVYLVGIVVSTWDTQGRGHNRPVVIAKTVPILKDSAIVAWDMPFPPPIPNDDNIMQVLAMLGTYYTSTMEKQALEFELIPGGLQVARDTGLYEAHKQVFGKSTG